MWTMKIFLQICYICTLFLIFLFGFDLPNFRKYLKDDSVLVLSKEILINPTQAPAITFCPTNPISGFGLKTIYGNKYKPNDTLFKNIWRHCNPDRDIGKCVMEETYDLEEAVPNMALAGSYLKKLESIERFTSDI